MTEQKAPRKRKAAPNEAPAEPKCLEFETFRKIGSWEISNLTQREPSCFNRFVSIKRYRVTIEEIEEPVEVLAERLRMLWRKSRNMHDYDPLTSVAKHLGIELDHHERGKDRHDR